MEKYKSDRITLGLPRMYLLRKGKMDMTGQIESAKCEYEENGHCTLNECMYGDFLERDDSRFDSGKYCFCDDVSKYVKKEEKRG